MAYSKTDARKIIDKLDRNNKKHDCPVCGRPVYSTDDFEYTKTKRKTEIFIHSDCLKRWAE